MLVDHAYSEPHNHLTTSFSELIPRLDGTTRLPPRNAKVFTEPVQNVTLKAGNETWVKMVPRPGGVLKSSDLEETKWVRFYVVFKIFLGEPKREVWSRAWASASL